MVEVTKLYRISNGSSLKAFADVIIDEMIVKGIRVVKNRVGDTFAAMPTQQGKNNKWYPIITLLNEDTRQELQEAVLEAYNA